MPPEDKGGRGFRVVIGEVVEGRGFLLTESRVGLAACFSRAGPEVEEVEDGGRWSCLEGRPRSIMVRASCHAFGASANAIAVCIVYWI